MAHFTIEDLKHGKKIPSEAEVVIVGAGMSGLYCAWRILTEQPKTSVVILDQSNRTGGRLDSDIIKFKMNDDQTVEVKEEEGGMRFTFHNMDDLMSLFLELDLTDQIVPFPMDSGGNNRLTFRGSSFNNGDVDRAKNATWSHLYKLGYEELGKSPGVMVNDVFDKVLDANKETFTEDRDDRSPEFWQKFRNIIRWKGDAIVDWTLWNLFSDLGYSNEAIKMLYSTLGFNGVFLTTVNAGIAFQLLEEFPTNPGFKTLEKGFSELPNALVKKVGMERIFLKTYVGQISTIENKEGYSIKYTTVNDKEEYVEGAIQAEKVILGLPRLALEKLFVGSNALNRIAKKESRQLWNHLQSTYNYPLLKINLYYEKPWWNKENTGEPTIGFGPNTSDLPLGFVYPFYAIDEPTVAALEYKEYMNERKLEVPSTIKEKLHEIRDRKYEVPAALTIYCDYLNIPFWKGTQQRGEKFDSPMQREQNSKEIKTIYPASTAVVAEATKYFKILFNTEDVPEPVLTSARIWAGTTLFDAPPSEQFGYGVHFWNLHARDIDVQQFMKQPIPNIFTCGEAFSDYQGWVEGALRSADLVLDVGFGIEAIKKKYLNEHGIKPSKAVENIYAENITKTIRAYVDEDFVWKPKPKKKNAVSKNQLSGSVNYSA